MKLLGQIHDLKWQKQTSRVADAISFDIFGARRQELGRGRILILIALDCEY